MAEQDAEKLLELHRAPGHYSSRLGLLCEHGKSVAHSEQFAVVSDKTQARVPPPGRTGVNVGGERTGFDP